MQLTRDQRAVLEAVYAIEKLPDASLRERLGRYLNLTTRQIQVWFQNRRQRSKAAAPGEGKGEEDASQATPSLLPPSGLNTSDQILEALFEFGRVCGNAQGIPGFPCDSRALAAAAVANVPVDASFPPLMEGETFDWALQAQRNSPTTMFLQGIKRSGSDTLLSASNSAASLAACMPTSVAPLTLRQPAALGALLSFLCHALGADACDFWRTGAAEPTLVQYFLPAGSLKASDMAACRAMLVAPLVDHVVRTREMVWFGISPEQQELLRQAGVSTRKVLAVPCMSAEASTPNAPPPAAAAPGVMILYTSQHMEQSDGLAILARLIGSAIAAADALQPSSDDGQVDAAVAAASPLAPVPGYVSIPQHTNTSMGSLLLAFAHALRADVAEHWCVRRSIASNGGERVVLSLEQMLAGGAVHNSPHLVRDVGEAEAAHPFSSQMCQATLYACKLIWCHATSASGVLEGLRLPMHTSVGLPICDRSGATTSVFVVYSLRRLEETAAALHFLSQLQVLAAAYAEFAPGHSCSVAFEVAANATVSTPTTGAVCGHMQLGALPGQFQQQQALRQLLQQRAEMQGVQAIMHPQVQQPMFAHAQAQGEPPQQQQQVGPPTQQALQALAQQQPSPHHAVWQQEQQQALLPQLHEQAPAGQFAMPAPAPERPSSAPPCPTEQAMRGAHLPGPTSVSADLPAQFLGSGVGSIGFDISADQVLSFLDCIPLPESAPPAAAMVGASNEDDGGGDSGDGDADDGDDDAELAALAGAIAPPIPTPTAKTPTATATATTATSASASASGGGASPTSLPSPPMPTPLQQKLPKLEALPLVHSGLSGDLSNLDLLFMGEEPLAEAAT